MTLHIPQAGDHLRADTEWCVRVDWRKQNLRMLKAFKLTGMKEVGERLHWFEDSNGNYAYETRKAMATVPNKLFMDNDGEFVPVELTFEPQTEFEILRFNVGPMADPDCDRHWNRAIISVDLRCTHGLRKGIKGLILQLPVEDLNSDNLIILPYEHIED